MTRPVALTIVCTDRGQHSTTLLGELNLGGMLRANGTHLSPREAERRKDECVWLEHVDEDRPDYQVNMRCPRCGRHVEWRSARAIDLIGKLAAASVSRIDLSAIP